MVDINFVYLIKDSDLKAAGMFIGPVLIAPAIVGMSYFLKDMFDSNKTVWEGIERGFACNYNLSPLGLINAGEDSRDQKFKYALLLSAVSYGAVLGAIITNKPAVIGAAACAIGIQVLVGAGIMKDYFENNNSFCNAR